MPYRITLSCHTFEMSTIGDAHRHKLKKYTHHIMNCRVCGLRTAILKVEKIDTMRLLE